MNFKKVAWLVIMACLSLALYTIVLSRTTDMSSNVILGGADTVYVGAESASYTDPNAEEVVVDDGLDWPDIDITLPQYTIVNADNLLSSAYVPDIAYKPEYDSDGNVVKDEDGNIVYSENFDPIYGTKWQAFAVIGKPYLDQMLQDMEAEGFTPYVASSYRTYSYQNQLFNTKATGIYMEMGYDAKDWASEEYQEAVEEAKKYTAVAGASEHQLGLAVDLYDRQRQRLSSYEDMDEDFRNWLETHCAEYGFIQRYPTRKCLRTGWDEPWHYRYVGVEVAQFIMKQGICYEEFYKHYVPDFEY